MEPLKMIYGNKAILELESSGYLNEQVKSRKLNWLNTDQLFRQMWAQLKSQPFFSAYAAGESPTFADDRKALNEWMQVFIGDSVPFNEYLEALFINWEDDQVLVTTMLLKSIDRIREQGTDEYISVPGDNQEDIQFMRDLFNLSVEHDDELTRLIGDKTQNWEPERIAMADMLMMKMALCEILYFPYIPVKVSINEYLELAKLYSTPNSHGFINGILDKVQIKLKKSDKIVKQGRGLAE